MSDTIEATGGCLCGAVRVTAKHAGKSVGACHCKMCRAWGGGPFLAVDCGADFTVEGEENVSVFDSSQWAERGFCSKCGSHLYYRLKANKQHFVPVGLFGRGAEASDSDSFILDHQVFIDEKPAYYGFANETEDMTGAEVFAKFGAAPD